MKVSELIAQLQKLPQDARIELNISGPADAAYTKEITNVQLLLDATPTVEIRGWVASDDEDAYMPGYDTSDDEDDEED